MVDPQLLPVPELSSGALASITLTLADGQFLVSFWKPVVIALPFAIWARLISNSFDKFAARYYLGREKWNIIHMCFGLAALAAALFMPLQGIGAFFAGLGAAILLLAIDVAWFVSTANKSDKVPEVFRIKIMKELMGSSFGEGKKKEVDKNAGTSELVIKGPDKSTVPVPAAETPELVTRVAAEGVALRAIVARASQVDVAPTGKDTNYGEIMLVDGVRQAGQTHAAAEAVKIVDFWKTAAKLDVNDRRKKLTADVNIEKGELRKKIRVIAAGVQGGMKMTLLFDPEKQVRRKPEEMGFVDRQLDEIKAMVEEKKGTVIVCTPPDGGRTTLLYTILKMHDAYTNNVQTVEIEPQDELEGIKCQRWDPYAEGPEFSTLVRSVLRRDPDIVGVAEVPDQNTAKEICRADQERSRIYASFKGENAMVGLQNWSKLVGDLQTAMPAVHGVVAGRTMRRLCTQCRQAYVPAPDMLKKFGLPAGSVKQLYKKGGVVMVKDKEQVCGMCNGVGYVGQIGFFEIYKIEPQMREMLKAGDWNGFRAELKKKQLPTLQSAALKHAIDGVTSVEEVVRATTDGQPPAGGAGQAAAKPAAAPASAPANPAAKKN